MSIIGALPRRSERGLAGGLQALKRRADSAAANWAADGGEWGVCDESEAGRLGGLHGLLDGRLDNAVELAASLGIELASGPELLLHAFRRWGVDFPGRLLGDFACAVWDGDRRRLILARDTAGYRPLHYWTGGGEFRFASEARGLFGFEDIPRAIDETRVAEWLTRTAPGEASFFRGISAVPMGHTLVFEQGQVVLRDFWAPEKVPLLRLADPRGYAEGLRSVLEQAVAARLRGEAAVASHLSGGLDSSSVAATAARLLAPRGGRVMAFTAVPAAPMDDSRFRGRFCDEGMHAAATAAMYTNIEHLPVPNNAGRLLESLDRMSAAAECPQLNPGNGIWFDAILREAQRRGLRVLLTGSGGNFSSSYDGRRALSTLAGSGRLFAAAALARARYRQGQPWRPLVGQFFRPLLPWWAQPRRGRLIGSMADATGLRAEFARAQGLAPEQSIELARDLDSRALRIWCLRRLDLGMHAAAARRLAGVEMSDPTTDRRVVEFCLSVPEEHFIEDGMPRSLIREAMTGYLPEVVRRETRHGRQSADVLHHLAAEKSAIAAEIAQLGRCDLAARCLDLPRMRELFAQFPTGAYGAEEYNRYGVGFLRALSMGRFLRRLEAGEIFPPPP